MRALSLATVALLVAAGCEEKPAPPVATEPDSRPNIVLLTIDTVRFDHLDAYGHDRPTSPNLTKLARAGIRFEQAISQSSWTLPSLASIHTGLYPSEHNAVRMRHRVPRRLELLAESMKAEGYTTVGIISHTFANAAHGFGQGFDVFDETQVRGHQAITSEAISLVALERLREVDLDKPFFMWVHYFDPHNAYRHHPQYDYASKFQGGIGDKRKDDARRTFAQLTTPEEKQLFVDYLRALYDEEITFTDEKIGRLFVGLEELGVADRTVYFITSDHGEYFNDHQRFYHTIGAYQELLHVPLIVGGALPEGLKGKVVEARVETALIPATVMDLLGKAEHSFRGPSLLDVARGDTEIAAVFGQAFHSRTRRHRTDAVFVGDFKLIHNRGKNTYEMYNLRLDPKEANNLVDRNDLEATRNHLREHLDVFRGKKKNVETTVQKIEYTPEEIKMLKALGYME